MSIIIFVVILVVLIVGHEFGHFIVAKLSKMKVLEFGLGFPPKLWSRWYGGTEYSLNAIPFGGFVRIFGEDSKESLNDHEAFHNRPVLHQAAVIFSGPFANFVLAYIFTVAALTMGVPAVIGDENVAGDVANARVVVADVVPGSPAALAGLSRGDYIVSVSSGDLVTLVANPEDLVGAIASAEEEVSVRVQRGGQEVSFVMAPLSGIVADDPDRMAIGVASALIGTVSYPPSQAIVRGFTHTVDGVKNVFFGLLSLIGGALTFSADLTDIAGPVGIASLVGEAAVFGAGSLFSLIALVSINLGIINLLPFPALDGGRLAMLGVETVARRKIPHRVSNAINYAGFVLLIGLMVAVTVNDIANLIG